MINFYHLLKIDRQSTIIYNKDRRLNVSCSAFAKRIEGNYWRNER